MKIELYLVPNDIHGKAIKLFLNKNKLPHKEIITENLEVLRKAAQYNLNEKISLLKVTYSSGIHAIIGFNKRNLNQLLEHIKKYKSKVEDCTSPKNPKVL